MTRIFLTFLMAFGLTAAAFSKDLNLSTYGISLPDSCEVVKETPAVSIQCLTAQGEAAAYFFFLPKVFPDVPVFTQTTLQNMFKGATDTDKKAYASLKPVLIQELKDFVSGAQETVVVDPNSDIVQSSSNVWMTVTEGITDKDHRVAIIQLWNKGHVSELRVVTSNTENNVKNIALVLNTIKFLEDNELFKPGPGEVDL